MANELLQKNVSVSVKDADKGLVQVEFATLGVKDRDGDFTLPGAFGTQQVALASYGHGWRSGHLPIGKGTISEKGNKAVGEFQVFMNSAAGREHFEVVKEMGDLQEWSYGFEILETGELTEELRQIGVWRVIQKVRVYEVSPVLVGAGVGTRTLAAKDAKPATPPKSGPDRHRVLCDCGRVLGEAHDSLIFVGKVKELAEVQVSGPRDVRYCKSCNRLAVYIPKASLTRSAA